MGAATRDISDVSYHEWGHGFHYYNLLSGEYDGAMSEGISDAVAFLQTGSPYSRPISEATAVPFVRSVTTVFTQMI